VASLSLKPVVSGALAEKPALRKAVRFSRRRRENAPEFHMVGRHGSHPTCDSIRHAPRFDRGLRCAWMGHEGLDVDIVVCVGEKVERGWMFRRR